MQRSRLVIFTVALVVPLIFVVWLRPPSDEIPETVRRGLPDAMPCDEQNWDCVIKCQTEVCVSECLTDECSFCVEAERDDFAERCSSEPGLRLMHKRMERPDSFKPLKKREKLNAFAVDGFVISPLDVMYNCHLDIRLQDSFYVYYNEDGSAFVIGEKGAEGYLENNRYVLLSHNGRVSVFEKSTGREVARHLFKELGLATLDGTSVIVSDGGVVKSFELDPPSNPVSSKDRKLDSMKALGAFCPDGFDEVAVVEGVPTVRQKNRVLDIDEYEPNATVKYHERPLWRFEPDSDGVYWEAGFEPVETDGQKTVSFGELTFKREEIWQVVFASERAYVFFKNKSIRVFDRQEGEVPFNPPKTPGLKRPMFAGIGTSSDRRFIYLITRDWHASQRLGGRVIQWWRMDEDPMTAAVAIVPFDDAVGEIDIVSENEIVLLVRGYLVRMRKAATRELRSIVDLEKIECCDAFLDGKFRAENPKKPKQYIHDY